MSEWSVVGDLINYSFFTWFIFLQNKITIAVTSADDDVITAHNTTQQPCAPPLSFFDLPVCLSRQCLHCTYLTLDQDINNSDFTKNILINTQHTALLSLIFLLLKYGISMGHHETALERYLEFIMRTINYNQLNMSDLRNGVSMDTKWWLFASPCHLLF